MRYAVPRTIRTPEQLEEMVEHYSGLDEFVFDVETVGKKRGHPRLNRVSWIGFAAPGCRADVIPLGHPLGEVIVPGYKQREPWWDENSLTKTGKPRKKWRMVTYPSTFTAAPEQLWASDVFDALKPLFFSEARKIGHNVKFDLSSISKYYGGALIPPPYGDTLIAAHLLNSSLRYGLKEIIKRLYEHFYDEENIAKPDPRGENGIEAHAFSKAARYTALDVRYTWMLWEQFVPQLRKFKMEKLFDLEMDVLEVLLAMEDAGVRIDTKAMVKLGVELRERMVEIEKSVFSVAGTTFDINSNQQKAKFVYETRGHEVFAWTKGGKDGKNKQPSTAAAVLETYATRDDAVADLLDYSAVQKLYSTYVGEQLDDGSYEGGLLEHLIDGRLHADFVQYGTDTGRFSCVAGDTLLHTSRGTFRFDEYEPVEGDLVPTHGGRWMPVLRKIFKGTQQMYSVVLSTGAHVTCTAEHRVLTPKGWEYVGNLGVGDEVCGYERVEEVRVGSEQRGYGTGAVSPRSFEADYCGDGPSNGDDVPQRPGDLEGERGLRGAEARAGAAVLTVEDRRQEPDDRKEWFPAPQLRWGRGGREGLPPEEGGRTVRLRSSDHDGRGARTLIAPERVCCASHQRGQEGQPTGQPRAGDPSRAQETSRLHPTVTEIHPVGSMGVWDIEVAGDHSYATQGLFHHNCRRPNLQNIPKRAKDERSQLIRKMFIPDEGESFIVADYGQIEYRVLAHYSEDPTLVEAFFKGYDPHAATAAILFDKHIDDVTDEERSTAKNFNFAEVYGAGLGKLAGMAGVSFEQVKKLKGIYNRQFPRVQDFKKEVIKTARNRKPPYVSTMLGRRRYLPGLWSNDDDKRYGAERQAVNTVVQGTAADIIKIAMVKLHHALELEFNGQAKTLIQVHDELVVTAPDEISDDVRHVMQETMEGVSILTVPLEAEANIGKSWSEAK